MGCLSLPGDGGLRTPHEQDFRERWISGAALPRENQLLSIPARIPALALLVQALLLQFLGQQAAKEEFIDKEWKCWQFRLVL